MKVPGARSVAWTALLGAVVLWAALVVSAPVIGQASGAGRGAGPAVAAVAYLAGSAVCHQRDGRSFHLAGAQLPVCGRCTGLYVFAALGVVLSLAVPRRWWGRGRPPGARLFASWRAWLIAAAAPSALTLAAEWSGAPGVSNAVRAAAAAPLGLAVGALLVEAAGFRGRL